MSHLVMFAKTGLVLVRLVADFALERLLIVLVLLHVLAEVGT